MMKLVFLFVVRVRLFEVDFGIPAPVSLLSTDSKLQTASMCRWVVGTSSTRRYKVKAQQQFAGSGWQSVDLWCYVQGLSHDEEIW